MKKVLICCNTGVTTSMLVAKIKNAARERELDIDVEATPMATAADKIGGVDVVLLGPQVGYAKAAFEEAGAQKVEVISVEDYAQQAAGAILDRIEALV